MSIRIDITWDFVSPIMQVAKGRIKILEFKESYAGSEPDIILQCRCSIERGSYGFQELYAKNDKVFLKFEEAIKIMMRSYFDGLLLQNEVMHWVEESLEKGYQYWKKDLGA